MSKTAIIHARIEPQTKKKAEGVLKKLGLSPTEAIRLFYKQICLRRGLPFPVLVPNSATAEVLNLSYQDRDIESFNSLNEMFESWEG